MKSILKILIVGFVISFLSCNGTKQTNENSFEKADSSITSTTPEVSHDELFKWQWNLKELGGLNANDSVNQKPFLLFASGPTNAVSGYAGCNRLSGSFEFTGGNGIKFLPLVTTKMACPAMDFETKLLDAIQHSDSWEISGDELSLSKGNVTSVKFEKADRPAEN